MIVLDTNVVSEAMRPSPNPAVIGWLDAQAASTLFITAITHAEILFGIAVIAAGHRKDQLNEAYEGIAQLFPGRILAFDDVAARRFATIATAAREAGKAFPLADGLIAAITATHGFAVASRDTGPFEAAKLDVIDPWDPGP